MHQRPQKDLEHLTVKGTLFTLSTCHQGPPSDPFCSKSSRIREVVKNGQIENAPNDFKLTLNTYNVSVKSTRYTLHVRICTNFAPFLCTKVVFEIQGCPE